MLLKINKKKKILLKLKVKNKYYENKIEIQKKNII